MSYRVIYDFEFDGDEMAYLKCSSILIATALEQGFELKDCDISNDRVEPKSPVIKPVGGNKKAIMDYLKANAGSTITQIAKGTGIDYKLIGGILYRMRDDLKIAIQSADKKWTFTGTDEQIQSSPQEA